MKHLNDDERLAYLEGRASSEITDHASQCAECAAAIAAWRRSAQRLQHFDWPTPIRHRSAPAAPMLKWAIAAGIVLCVGFSLGRLTGPSAAKIQAAVKADVLREIQKQRPASPPDQSKPQIDANTILALLTELREQQSANYLSLRKDLETLASTADARLQSTRRQILDLAAGAQNFSDLNK
jgi:hypothetical protein